MKQKRNQEKLLTWLCEWTYKKDIQQFLKSVDSHFICEKNIPSLLNSLSQQFSLNRLFSKETFLIIAEKKIREWIKERKANDVVSLFMNTDKPKVSIEELHEKFPEYTDEEIHYFLEHHKKVEEILKNSPLLNNTGHTQKEKLFKMYWNNIKKLIDEEHHNHLFNDYSALKEKGYSQTHIESELKRAFPEIENPATKTILDFEMELKQSHLQGYRYYLLKKRTFLPRKSKRK